MRPDEFKIQFQEATPIELPETITQLSPWQPKVRSKLSFNKSAIVLLGKEKDPSTDANLRFPKYAFSWRIRLMLIYQVLVSNTLKDRSVTIPVDNIDRLIIAGKHHYHLFNIFQKMPSGHIDVHIFFTTRNRDIELVEMFKKSIPNDSIEETSLPWIYKTIRWYRYR